MIESILLSIKKKLGIDATYTAFDTDIILGINSALFTLNQLGVGPVEGFVITGETETWSSFIGSRKDLEQVKEYVYLRTKLEFDPPASSYVLSHFEEKAKEYEWRLNVQVENNPM